MSNVASEPERAGMRHALIFAAFSAVTAASCLTADTEISFTVQLVPLIASVALLGIPHGALDFALLNSLAKRFDNQRVLRASLAVYSAIAMSVITAWTIFPAFMLAAFLLASVLHFGIEDTRATPAWNGEYLAEVPLRGSLPIVLPVALHSNEAVWLFSQLIPAAAAAALSRYVAALWPVLPVLAILLMAARFANSKRASRQDGSTPIELLAVSTLFAAAPPLVAFAVYFGPLHSLRHLIRLAQADHRHRPVDAAKQLIAAAWPVTLITWVMAAGAVAAFPPERIGIQLMLQVLFIGLAALTFPHALLLIGLRLLKWRDSNSPIPTHSALIAAEK